MSKDQLPTSSSTPEDPQDLKKQIWAELEAEHLDREERAQRKSERRKNRRQQDKLRSKERDEIRADLRREFYEQHGYEEKVDPTGRKMYLSPSELENKRRRKKGRRSSKKKSFTLADVMGGSRFGQLPIYLMVAIVAVFVALIVVKGS